MIQGCSWQDCRGCHRFAEGLAYARNLLQALFKAQQVIVSAALRSVFAQQAAYMLRCNGIG